MSDLISRADAIDTVEELNRKVNDGTGYGTICTPDVLRRINALPSADAVEVVRCKDCRHANECHKSIHYTRNEPNTVTIGYLPIEWCSRGER